MSDGEKFLLLNQRAGWQALQVSGVTVGETLRLQALPGFSRPLADAQGTFGGLSMPTGLALDGAGRVYVLDGPAARICRFDPCEEQFEPLPLLGGPGRAPRRFDRPRGIAISAGDDLFVADSGNRRVQVFALKGLVLRAIWGPYRVTGDGPVRRLVRITDPRLVGEARRPAGDPADPSCDPPAAGWPDDAWQPWDVALAPDGRVYVSDHANGLVHRFDPRGRWRGSSGDAGEGQLLSQPTHLALDRHGNLYVAQEGQAEIVVLDAEGRFLRRVDRPEQVAGDFAPLAIGFDPAGRLLACAGRPGRLFLYGDDERAAVECRAFTGHGCAMAVDAAGKLYVADGLSHAVHVLESDVTFATQGVLLAGPLDSRVYRCQWHRLAFQLELPAGASLQVDTFSAEAPRSAGEIANLPEERWATRQVAGRVGAGEWDCLVLSPPGRYLWLRLTLRGDGQATPVIGRIQAHYPRASSLRHLPAVYREDADSAEFLDRFLSIFDRQLAPIGDSLTAMAAYFDPQATPAASRRPGEIDFLTWLASWLGLALEQHWSEEKRRLLVEQAHRLFALRGTLAGLRLHVQIYAGVEPQVVEHFKLRRWLMLGGAGLGDGTVLWGADAGGRLQLGVHSRIGEFALKDSGDPQTDPFDVYAHRFTLYVPWPGASAVQRMALERIVEEARPAHTLGDLEVVEPRLRVGAQSIVGVNTIIGCYPEGVALSGAQLGRDSVLSASPAEAGDPGLRIGTRSRLGASTRLA